MKYENVGFHPNINTVTVVFNSKYITKVLDYYNVEYTFITTNDNN